jgi:hypothetical protein
VEREEREERIVVCNMCMKCNLFTLKDTLCLYYQKAYGYILFHVCISP